MRLIHRRRIIFLQSPAASTDEGEFFAALSIQLLYSLRHGCTRGTGV